MLTLQVNGQTSATVRQGDRVDFDIGANAAGVEIDFEGSGAWTPAAGSKLHHVFRQAGRFVAAARRGGDIAQVMIHVTRVTGTGGAGIF
jgi:hypothetical protein